MEVSRLIAEFEKSGRAAKDIIAWLLSVDGTYFKLVQKMEDEGNSAEDILEVVKFMYYDPKP